MKIKGLLLLLCLAFAFIVTDAYVTLEKDKIIRNQEVKKGEGGMVTFEYPIPKEFKSDKDDIMIHVKPEDSQPYSDPDVYIFKSDKDPSNQDESFRKCRGVGEEMCVVNGQDLIPGEKIFASVSCTDMGCTFWVELKNVSEAMLVLGTPLAAPLNKGDERIYKVEVPQDLEIRSVTISVQADDIWSKFDMLVDNRKGIKPSSGESIKGDPAYLSDRVVKFLPLEEGEACDPNSPCFCTGCTYSILVQVQTTDNYTIMAKTNMIFTELEDNKPIYDYVGKNEMNCYKYYVRVSNKDMVINLTAYSGNPNLYVNPSKMFLNTGDADFKSEEYLLDQELTLTPTNREDAGATIGDYYICVKGLYPASYSLNAFNKYHQRTLKGNTAEAYYIEGWEEHVFYYRESILKKDIFVTLQLHIMQGQAQVEIELCKLDPDEIEITQCDYQEEEVINPLPENHRFGELGGITLRHLGDDCSSPEGKRASCMYRIKIAGKRRGVRTHYSFTIIDEEKKYIFLKEGVPYNGVLDIGRRLYYKFNVDDNNVTDVKIQLTSLHGDVDAWAARDVDFPTVETKQHQSTHCGQYPDLVYWWKSEKDPDLTGMYALTLTAYGSSTFNLIYYMHRKGIEEKPTQLLIKKEPTNGMIEDPTKSLVYELQISGADNLWIKVDPEQGNFECFVSVDKIPTFDDYTWSFNTESYKGLFISKNQDKEAYKTTGTYYVRVRPDYLLVVNDKDDLNFTFVIQYNIIQDEDNKIELIMEGRSKRSNVEKGKFIYYDYRYSNLTLGDIIIDVTPLQGDPDIVVSLSIPNIKNPNTEDDTHHKKSESSGGDSIQITKKELEEHNKACIDQIEDITEENNARIKEDKNKQEALDKKNKEKKDEDEFGEDDYISSHEQESKRIKKQKLKEYPQRGICVLRIGVTTQKSDVAVFTLMVSQQKPLTADVVKLLVDGVPQFGQVKPKHKFNYYIFKATNKIPVYIGVTKFGTELDLDVYLSVVNSHDMWMKEYIQPSETHYYKKSQGIVGTDVVSMSPEDLDKAHCSGSCFIYLGIKRNISKEQSRQEEIRRNQIKFKKMLEERVRLAIKREELIENDFGWSQRNDSEKVIHYEEDKTPIQDPETVEIPIVKPKEIEHNQINKHLSFILTANKNVITLTEIKPLEQDIIGGTYKYYKFLKGCEDCLLTITLSITKGNTATMAVTHNKKDTLPSHDTNYHFLKHVHTSDSLVIDSNDEHFTKMGIKSSGYYLIGISTADTIKFTLAISTNNEGAKYLYPSKAIIQINKAHDISKFSYNHQQDHEFIITIDAELGVNPEIYVRTIPGKYSKELLNFFPQDVNQAIWTNAKRISSNSVLISKNNGNFCTNCEYLISVYSSRKCRFKVEILVDTQSKGDYGYFLPLDFPYQIKLKKDNLESFHFSSDSKMEDLEIRVETIKHRHTEDVVKTYVVDDAYKVKNFNRDNAMESGGNFLRMKGGSYMNNKSYYLVIQPAKDERVTIVLRKKGKLTLLSDGFPEEIALKKGMKHQNYYVMKLSSLLLGDGQGYQIALKSYPVSTRKGKFQLDIYMVRGDKELENMALDKINNSTLTYYATEKEGNNDFIIAEAISPEDVKDSDYIIFAILNGDQVDQEIKIIVTSNNVYYLPTEYTIHGSAPMQEDKFIIYEVRVPLKDEKGHERNKIYGQNNDEDDLETDIIQIIGAPCLGGITISIGTSFRDILEDHALLEQSIGSGEESIQKRGKWHSNSFLYVALQAKYQEDAAMDIDRSEYNIQARFDDKQTDLKLVSENDGNLVYTQDKDLNINLNWGIVMNERGNQVFGLTYFIFKSKQSFKLQSLCAAEAYGAQIIAGELTGERTFSLAFESMDEQVEIYKPLRYYINVFAKSQSNGQQVAFYPIKIVYKIEEKTKIGKFIFQLKFKLCWLFWPSLL